MYLIHAFRRPALALWLAVGAIVLSLLAAAAHAQPQPPFPPQGPFVQGVFVDADGLLAVQKKTDDPRLLAERRAALIRAHQQAKAAGEKLGYISLPRVFAAARKCLGDNKELPADLRYLGGMTKLRYIFVYPQEQDLVVAGDTEPYDAADPLRPIGLRTGRPVLRLEDLVVALRIVGPGQPRGSFGCSIDMPRGAMKTVSDIIEDPQNRRLSKTKKAELMADQVGPQAVRIFGAPPDSRFAFVVVEADYLLKRLAMGIDPSPVAAVQVTHQKERMEYNRLWFTPNYDPVLVSADGQAFEIRGQALQLNAGGDGTATDEPSAGTIGYAKNFTKHFPQMAQAIPAFADLWNLADLGLLAALIGREKLDKQAGWDIRWLQSDDGFPVARAPIPRTAATMAHYRGGIYIVGGVSIHFADALDPKKRQQDAGGKLKQMQQRPDEGEWIVLK